MDFKQSAAKIEAHGKGRAARGHGHLGWASIESRLAAMTKKIEHRAVRDHRSPSAHWKATLDGIHRHEMARGHRSDR